jgi:hypothetical protein
MSGQSRTARPVAQRVAERHWGYPFERLIGPAEAASPVPRQGAMPDTTGSDPPVDPLEALRQGVHDAVSMGALTEVGAGDREQTVVRHGQATRYRPPGLLLVELAADFAELQRCLTRRHTASTRQA